MNKFIIALALVAAAGAAPSASTKEAIAARRALPALNHEEIHDQFGQYALRYSTAEGTIVEERGRLIPNNEHTGYVMVIEGSTTYVGEDGQIYVTKYSAGPDGTKVEGNHLPVAPQPEPVPEIAAAQ